MKKANINIPGCRWIMPWGPQFCIKLIVVTIDTTYYWHVVARYGEEDYGLETDAWSFTTSVDYSLDAITVPGDITYLQDAIDAASDGDTILVADGTYYPPDVDGFDFRGKAITVRSVNGPAGCIISGGGNGRGFIFQTGEQGNSIVSGFTITGGNIRWGSGGGGILCEWASPTISNCIIRNNSVEAISWGGGGISCVSSAPVIKNCLIENNSAVDAFGGGGIYCEDATPVIIKCTIVNNSAGLETGGGIYLVDSFSTATITNTIFWYNAPDQIDNDFATLNVTFSNIQGGFTGTGNINSDPIFEVAGYALAPGSPCIDAGTAYGAPSSDIEGTTRPLGVGYDMGAYESQ